MTTVEYARQAGRQAAHQISAEDTLAGLRQWVFAAYPDAGEGPQPDGWVKQNTDGTFAFYDSNGLAYVTANVGDFVCNFLSVYSAAQFAANYIWPDPSP